MCIVVKRERGTFVFSKWGIVCFLAFLPLQIEYKDVYYTTKIDMFEEENIYEKRDGQKNGRLIFRDKWTDRQTEIKE